MANESVKVVSPDGQPGEIPAGQLSDATEQGYRVLTPEVQAELDRHEKYGGALGMLGSAAAGGARGLSLGLSDLALTQSGLVEPQTLKDLKEENPVTSTVSEIAGNLVPVVGELGLGAKLGGEAAGLAKTATSLSPAAGATKVGAGIESAVSQALGSQMAAKLAGATARGAAEAELYNIGHNLSEASLGDEQLTAERLLAHSGEALAVGAGLGFGLSAGGMALKAAAQKASGALDGLSSLVAEKFPLASPDVLNNYAEKTAARAGMEPEEVKQLFTGIGTKEGQAMREGLGKSPFVTPDERNAINKEFRETLEKTHEDITALKRKAFNEIRPKEIGNLVQDVDIKAASESAFGLADDIQTQIKHMEANPDIFSAKGLVAKMKGIEEGYAKRLLAVESPEEMFTLINDTKQLIDKQTKIWGKSINPADAATVDVVKGLRRQFADHLTDESMWGQAAVRQEAFNEATARLLTAEKNLIGLDGKVGAFGQKVNGKGGRVEIVINPKKINTFLSQTGADRSELQTTALREYLEAARDFAQQVEHSAGGAEADFSKAGYDSLLSKTAKIAADAEKKLAMESKVRQAARLDDIGMNMFPGTAAAAMGAVVGGIPGAAAVGVGAKVAGEAASDAVRAGTSPIAMAKTLARIEGFALGPAKTMSRAINAMTRGAEAVGENVVKREVGVATRKIIPEEDSFTRFQRAQAQIRDIVGNGSAQMAVYQAGTSRMADHAPKTQMATINKQMEIAQFLAAKLPTNPFAGSTTNPQTARWRPSDSQMAAYERYHRAAVDPVGTIEKACRGVVSKEGIETLKTLYPGIYKDFQQAMFQQVAMSGKPIPRDAAVALSAMFGTPLTPSMRPDVRNAVQAAPTPEKHDDKPNMPPTSSKTSAHLRTAEQSRSL